MLGVRTNAECLVRAHLNRCSVSKKMRQFKKPHFTKVMISVKDNAHVNFKANREIIRTQLPDFLLMELGCKIHLTAVCMKRCVLGILEFYISGQLHWALFLNRGQVLIIYQKAMYDTALLWIKPFHGLLRLTKLKSQRQIMALILLTHSYV